MDTPVTLSVVVPVYSVETGFLQECFESILNQTFRDFELIIVNDGASADLTDYIDNYDYRNANVTIIRQENKGVANARNTGLKACRGKYVTFVDADDTIESKCFEETVGFAEKNSLQVLMFGTYIVYGDRKKTFSPYLTDIDHFNESKKEELILKCMVGILPFYECPPASRDASGSAWAKLCRRDFLTENNLYYTDGLKRAEDMEYNLRVFDKASNIGFLCSNYYNYRQIADSATHIYRDGGLSVFTDTLAYIRSFITDSGKSELYEQVYYMRCMFFYLESMDMDYLNPNNPKPFKVRIRELAKAAEGEPYKEAFDNLRGDHLTFARRIPLFLIRHGLFATLALFYSVYRKMNNG